MSESKSALRPLRELGVIKSKQGNLVPARWDEQTGVIELQLYRFPLQGEPHWDWVIVGIAPTVQLAIAAATHYLGGE